MRKDTKLLQEYDQIMHDQLKDGIVERVSDVKAFSKECYLPHWHTIREAAESANVKIVFDASAKKKAINLLH